LNGIQAVSGSIPLISTKGFTKRPVFTRKQAFSLSFDKNRKIQHGPTAILRTPLREITSTGKIEQFLR